MGLIKRCILIFENNRNAFDSSYALHFRDKIISIVIENSHANYILISVEEHIVLTYVMLSVIHKTLS